MGARLPNANDASFSTNLKGMLDSLISRYYVADERVKVGIF